MDNTQELSENPVDLTPKQLQFAKEYVIDHNGAAAAVRAGYSVKSANVQASRLLTRDNIRSHIGSLEQSAAHDLGITHRTILSDIKAGIEQCKKDDNAMGVFKGCELLGKHLGTFEPKVRDLEQRPAFVGININMGPKPSVEILRANPLEKLKEGEGGPPESRS